jgi:hypothetical protein
MNIGCALNAGRHIIKASYKIGQFKSNIVHLAKDARFAAHKSWKAAEEMVEATTGAVARRPLTSIGAAFAVALGIGGMTGWLATRKR